MSMLSALVVVCYPAAETADEVLKAVRNLDAAHLLRLEDSVIIRRAADGRLSIDVTHPRRPKNAALGAVIGALVGNVVGLPLVGGGLGAVAGASALRVPENMIDERFAKQLAQYLGPESSALFVLVRRESADKVLIAPEKVIPELGRFGGTVLHTTMTTEQDDRLQAAIDEAHDRAENLRLMTTLDSVKDTQRSSRNRPPRIVGAPNSGASADKAL